jgi:hypothetical protein
MTLFQGQTDGCQGERGPQPQAGTGGATLHAPSSLSCREMPELIVRYFTRSLAPVLRGKADEHFATCPQCRARLLALGIATKIDAERLRGIMPPPAEPEDTPEILHAGNGGDVMEGRRRSRSDMGSGREEIRHASRHPGRHRLSTDDAVGPLEMDQSVPTQEVRSPIDVPPGTRTPQSIRPSRPRVAAPRRPASGRPTRQKEGGNSGLSAGCIKPTVGSSGSHRRRRS